MDGVPPGPAAGTGERRDRFNGQVIRYPLVAFYSASAIGLLFALLWARGNEIGGGFVGIS